MKRKFLDRSGYNLSNLSLIGHFSPRGKVLFFTLFVGAQGGGGTPAHLSLVSGTKSFPGVGGTLVSGLRSLRGEGILVRTSTWGTPLQARTRTGVSPPHTGPQHSSIPLPNTTLYGQDTGIGINSQMNSRKAD